MFDAVSVDSSSKTALIVMAIAISVQTVVIIGALIGLSIAWRRLQAAVDARYAELQARVNDAVQPIRHAAQAVEEVSQRAAGAMDRAGRAAGFLRTFLVAPRTAAVFAAATAARALLKRRMPAADTQPAAPSGSSTVH